MFQPMYHANGIPATQFSFHFPNPELALNLDFRLARKNVEPQSRSQPDLRSGNSMRPLRALLVFVLVVFVGGALLAPWLYWLTQAIAPGSHLAGSPFHRFVNRSLLGLALIGIWPLLRSLGARSWREVGLVNPAGEWRRVASGFALGFGSLSAAELGRKLLGAAGTAVIVSVLEEILFRGAIFGGLRRIWDWRFALLLSSAIYAIVHFMESARLSGPVTWTSGLELLPRMLRGFADWQTVIPGFFNLTLAGSLLALAYQRTGNLYLSMGLHAGWIFWLKSYGMVTSTVPGAHSWFFGTDKLIDGWLALLVLAFALAVLVRLPFVKRESVAVAATQEESR